MFTQPSSFQFYFYFNFLNSSSNTSLHMTMPFSSVIVPFTYMPNSPHQAPPAAENAPPTNSGCAGFDDRLKIHHISRFALQQQWKLITSAAFALVPEPDRITTRDP